MVQTMLPFRRWVPRWLGIVASFIVIIPIMLINGTYIGSSIDISGTLGILSEDITMAYYVTAAGMASAYPLISKTRPVITTKTVLLCDLILQVILCLICAWTAHIVVIMVCCFWIGFLKAFVMIEMIIILKPFFSPMNIRSEFYAYFYPIVFTLGQLATVLTALFAYHYQWQHIYYFVILLLLLAITTVLLLFRYGRRPVYFPVKEIDWLSFGLISLVLLTTIYGFTYGKTLDWFDSPTISMALLAAPCLFIWFIYRQKKRENPYLRLEVLKGWKPKVGYLYMAIVMFFSASSYLVSSYANSILKIDSVRTNELNLWLIPGFVVGAVVAFWWFRTQRFRFRMLVFCGMGCFTVYLAFLYWGITPDGKYEYLYIPTMLRGVGMMILFIAFGVFVVEDMNPRLMIYNAFFLICVRSSLAPVLSASFLSNMLYRLQQQCLSVLSAQVDLLNPLAASRYWESLHAAQAKGLSIEEASQLATGNLYQLLQTQSLLLAIKILCGYVLLFAFVLTFLSPFIPFHKTKKVEAVKAGEDMA